MRKAYLLAAALAVGIPACGEGRNDPAGTAVEFERHLLSGDVWKAYPLLSSLDTAVLSRRGFPENAEHVGISTAGLANATVDSARVLGATYFDTATVEVFLTVPNLQQAFQSIMQDAIAGGLGADTSTVRRRLEQETRTLPRVSQRRTRLLVKEDNEWRVWLAAKERQLLGSLADTIRETYLELPLRTRANWASRFLNSARGVPHVVQDELREEMLALIRQAVIADSLRISARIQEGYFSSHLEGTVINPTSAHIEELWFKVRDSDGTTQTVMVSGIPAHSTERYSEMVAIVGKGRHSIDVIRLELLGQGR